MGMQPGFVSAEGEAGPPSVTFASGGLSWSRVWLPRLLSRIGKGLYGMSALSVVVALLGAPDGFAAFTALSVLAWPLFITSYILSLTQTSFRGSLEVSANDLVLIGTNMTRKPIPRANIDGALVVERHVFGAFVPTVEIQLASGDVLTARLADPRAAHAVVRALGFGAGGRRVHASLAKPTRRLLHPLLAMFAYIASISGLLLLVSSSRPRSSGWDVLSLIYPLVALLLYELLSRLLRAPEVTVGDDGVMARRGLGSIFIPRREIRSVAVAGASIVIEGRKRVTLAATLMDEARAAAVARVIEERAGPSAATAERFTHYERGGRELPAWREHLHRAMQESSYRANAATVDEAALVLRSAQASPEQRVGAALALRIAGEPKERIRVAVEGAVDEDVRRALAAAAELSR